MQCNKSQIAMEIARLQMLKGRKIVFTAFNQKAKLAELFEYFPGSLISVIGDHYLEVHLRNRKLK